VFLLHSRGGIWFNLAVRKDKGGISHLILVFGLETSRIKSSPEQNSPSYLGTGPSLEIGGIGSSLAHAVSECFYCATDMLLHSSRCASAMPTRAGMAQQ
jgi:hypothetical protein